MQIHSKFLATVMVCAGMVVLSSCGGSGGSVSPEPTPAPSYEIGGTVAGLYSAESTVTLKNNADTVTVTGNGSFVFSKKVSGLGNYDVTIAREPGNPPQNCTVSNGSGVATGQVSSVQVNCALPATFSIGGTVTGLAGTDGGLVLANAQSNGTNQLAVSGNGTFTFTQPVVVTGSLE